jgi:hypothetical protein
MGRPLAELAFPVEKIKHLASFGCTDEEIASVCEVDVRTLQNRFGTLLKAGRDTFKTEIRQMQWKRMKEGSDTMLIWLGKVVLRQTENLSLTLDATDTLAAFVNSIREASPQGTKSLEGEALSPGEPLQD